MHSNYLPENYLDYTINVSLLIIILFCNKNFQIILYSNICITFVYYNNIQTYITAIIYSNIRFTNRIEVNKTDFNCISECSLIKFYFSHALFWSIVLCIWCSYPIFLFDLLFFSCWGNQLVLLNVTCESLCYFGVSSYFYFPFFYHVLSS